MVSEWHKVTARDAVKSPNGRYNYNPSFPAAAVFSALYVLATVINLCQLFFYRAWFWWVMNFAVILELVGYISRCSSIKHLDDNTTFIIQTILLLIAPAVMAASCYMAFGRVVLWVVPPSYQTFRHLWMPARHITPLFVSFDVLSLLVQGIGGGIVASANTDSQANRGKNIVLIGLGIQLFTFGFFVLASSRFNFLLRSKLRNEALPRDTNWPLLLIIINTSSFIILVRSISRFLQYALGVHNVLSDSEAYFYCLDAVPIYFVVVTFICFYPAQYLPYIRLRRDKLEFSKNVGRGLFKNLAAGKTNDYIVLDSDNNP